MKFTEEQYREIVQIAEEYTDFWRQYAFSTLGSRGNTNIYMKIREKVSDDQSMKLALAIANPVTREYAHEHFVEPEQCYVWTSKKTNSKGECLRLYKTIEKVIRGYITSQPERMDFDEHLTESEIREWGYDPERFDKEEV